LFEGQIGKTVQARNCFFKNVQNLENSSKSWKILKSRKKLKILKKVQNWKKV